MPKVTVVIPIYNVACYIEKCARSLFEQTLDDIEYIFVNDCTPDNSMEILYKVLEEYPRRKRQTIIVHHECNRGALAARQTAVAVAAGDFIIACDSDDWVELCMYEKMYDVAERENADMVWCDYYQDTVNSQKRISLAYSCDPVTYVKGIMTQHIPGSLCNKLYRKKLFKMHADVSVVGANMWEDLCITIAVTHYARKIIHIAQAFYHYRVDSTISIVRIHSVEKDRKRSQDMIRNVEAVTNFLYGNNLINLYIPELYILQLAAKSSLLWQLNPPLKEWKSTFPEANQYINSSSFYSKSLQYCALYNCTWVYVIRDLVRSFCSRFKKRIYSQNKK